jgi:hypothetical protein
MEKRYIVVVGKAGDLAATKIKTDMSETQLKGWIDAWFNTPAGDRADFYVEPYSHEIAGRAMFVQSLKNMGFLEEQIQAGVDLFYKDAA